MYLLRRSAAKALSSSPYSLFSQPRKFTTAAPRIALRPARQWAVSPLRRRFASDDAAPLTSEKTTGGTVPEPQTNPEVETSVQSSGEQSTEPTPTEAASVGGATQEQAAAPTQSSVPDANEATAFPQVAGAAAETDGTRPVPVDTSMANPSGSILYIGNLYFEVTEHALKSQFEQYGSIKSVRIVYDQRGLSRGFGYVEYYHAREAGSAIDALNQTIFQGRRMAVQFHKPRERRNLLAPRAPTSPTETLFIGNMSFEMSDKDLNDLFREVKNVTDVRVAIDRRTGQPRGFAHADFTDIESATNAMQLLKEKEIFGRRLRVDYSQSTSTQRRQE